MIEILRPFRAQTDRHDLVVALALNDPGGDTPGVAVNGKCGSWLSIHGFPPFDGRPARAERNQRAPPWKLSELDVPGSAIKMVVGRLGNGRRLERPRIADGDPENSSVSGLNNGYDAVAVPVNRCGELAWVAAELRDFVDAADNIGVRQRAPAVLTAF
jgi:hypothetical protein